MKDILFQACVGREAYQGVFGNLPEHIPVPRTTSDTTDTAITATGDERAKPEFGKRIEINGLFQDLFEKGLYPKWVRRCFAKGEYRIQAFFTPMRKDEEWKNWAEWVGELLALRRYFWGVAIHNNPWGWSVYCKGRTPTSAVGGGGRMVPFSPQGVLFIDNAKGGPAILTP
jgi:hypothetical protein